MTVRKSERPYGYRELLVYKKAEALQDTCAAYTTDFPREKTPIALADQMNRSARSVKQNIVEGWKRNSTREYYDFLGFSLGANAELEEDCDDIIKGRYEMGGRGIMGLKGEKRIEWVETLPFYPLDAQLPPIIQLKLRCKEMNMLLQKLQRSLFAKMEEDNSLSLRDKHVRVKKGERERDDWLTKEIDNSGLVRLPDGRLVPKGLQKGEMREGD